MKQVNPKWYKTVLQFNFKFFSFFYEKPRVLTNNIFFERNKSYLQFI